MNPWEDAAAVERAAEWLYTRIVGERMSSGYPRIEYRVPNWSEVSSDKRGTEWREAARDLLRYSFERQPHVVTEAGRKFETLHPVGGVPKRKADEACPLHGYDCEPQK